MLLFINMQKRNLPNVESSGLHAWPITHVVIKPKLVARFVYNKSVSGVNPIILYTKAFIFYYFKVISGNISSLVTR